MRLPRVRFTVRRLIVLVAVVAVGLWAARMWRLSREYQELAYRHAYGAATIEHIMQGPPLREAGHRDGGPTPREAYHDYEVSLAAKYFRAAACPWLRVAPDPPPPE